LSARQREHPMLLLVASVISVLLCLAALAMQTKDPIEQ
jgi:hypothetical protein